MVSFYAAGQKITGDMSERRRKVKGGDTTAGHTSIGDTGKVGGAEVQLI